ncbi:hypothetical protein TanjilG_02432 [Lupinus angustifolius]|uniref:Uncharacterized protein n=1 Tax=Lupinus angustifolius TaxID=3871 RepID=A0A1J7HYJ9_LUPAN|nr:hypothetical protein TanjilG_02432 [Lupinus angustifolius]
MLPLKVLADSINEKLLGHLFVGAELFVKKDDGPYPCKILKVIQEGVDKCCYEVAWLNKDKNITEKADVNAEDLVQKKPLFSRNILKSFIRESTYRNAPWVLHEELAQKHGISTDIPKELQGRIFIKNGILTCSKKRKNERDLYHIQSQPLCVVAVVLCGFSSFSPLFPSQSPEARQQHPVVTDCSTPPKLFDFMMWSSSTYDF